jgi:hypothetical protein
LDVNRLCGIVLAVILSGFPAAAQGPEIRKPNRLWKWSLAAVAAATAADISSSVGRYELNPVLGRGPFGGRQIGIKLGIAGGAMLVESLIVRRHPECGKAFAYGNLAHGAVTGAVAASNMKRTGK